MTESENRERFRHLPEPVRPEDTVETVDTAAHRLAQESEDRDRLLREAGGL